MSGTPPLGGPPAGPPYGDSARHPPAQYPPQQFFPQPTHPGMTYQPGWAPGYPVLPALPQPGSMPIGPNDLGKTFGSTFGTLRTLWKQVLVAVAPAVVLTAILVGVLGTAIARIAPTFDDRMRGVDTVSDFLRALPHVAALTLAGSLGYLLIAIYALSIVVGTAAAAGRSIAGDRMPPTFIVRSAVRALPRVLTWMGICAVGVAVFGGLGLLAFLASSRTSERVAYVGIVVLVAMIVGVAAQLLFALKLAFVIPAMMLEPRRADPFTGVVVAAGASPLGLLHAARRSWKLTMGRAWRTLGMTLLLSLLAGIGPGIVNQVLSLIASVVTNGTDSAAAYVIAYTIYFAVVISLSLIVGIIGTIGQTVLYTDARIRDEGIAPAILDHAASGSPADPWVRWHERY